MKKFFLSSLLALSITIITFGQDSTGAVVSTTPEVPRNYKPAPKELLPMPDSLTDEKIFPVLGEYEISDKEGNSSHITISKDFENKGLVWVSGLPQGKFKAALKASPTTYKIPAQKTEANDEVAGEAVAAGETATTETEEAPKKNSSSGKSIQEGTLIYDTTANTLYVNIGSKFNEDDPAYVFPEMMQDATATMAADSTTATADDEDKPATTSTKKKSTKIKGTTYTGSKINVQTEAPAVETDATAPADSIKQE